jgi:hypothetical protein
MGLNHQPVHLDIRPDEFQLGHQVDYFTRNYGPVQNPSQEVGGFSLN